MTYSRQQKGTPNAHLLQGFSRAATRSSEKDPRPADTEATDGDRPCSEADNVLNARDLVDELLLFGGAHEPKR